MKQLPHIDEHAIWVDAGGAAMWWALLRAMCRDPNDPSTVRTDFFALDEATPPKRLALRGQHPFSVYKLVLEVTDEGPQRTRLHALTWADFPGLSRKAYRALVIGTAHTASPCG
jgi:hypothetical protein